MMPFAIFSSFFGYGPTSADFNLGPASQSANQLDDSLTVLRKAASLCNPVCTVCGCSPAS
jgi:hypothetical protein